MKNKTKQFALVLVAFAVIMTAFIYWDYKRDPVEPTLFDKKILEMAGNEVETFPIYANCANPEKGEVEFTGKVIVHNDYNRFFNLEKFPEKAVKDQLKYLNGTFNWDHEFYKTTKLIHHMHESIEVLSVKKTSYFKDIDYDWISDNENLYPPTFRKNKSVKKGEPALEIIYKAKKDVSFCGDQKSKSAPLIVNLPYDPYLAYWLLKKEKRLEMEPNQHQAVMPCADRQIIDVNLPSFLWYLWSPHRTGMNLSKEKFDCSKLLKKDEDYQSLQANFSKKELKESPPDFELLKKQDVIHAKAIFGIMSGGADKSTFEKVLKLYKSKEDIFQLAKIKSGRINYDEFLTQDASAWALLDFLRGLEEVVDVKKSGMTSHEEFLILRIDGVLRASSKKVQFEIYLGPTDEAQKKARHWSFLREALAEGDIVFYVGHSGTGEDMGLSNLKKNLSLSDEEFKAVFAKKKYQFLGILSCYSQSYFGEEYFGQRIGKVSDVMFFVGGGYGFMLPLAALYYLDMGMSGEAVSFQRAMGLFLLGRETALVERR